MSEPVSIESARGVVILSCSSHDPGGLIEKDLAASELFVIRTSQPEERFHHDADYAATRFLDVHATLPAMMPVAYIGAGTSGAGALIAAGQAPSSLLAVVSINGRTDYAVDSLREVRVPALLIVNDMPVLRMNREALTQLRRERRLEVVHGDGALSLAHIAERAARWVIDRLLLIAA